MARRPWPVDRSSQGRGIVKPSQGAIALTLLTLMWAGPTQAERQLIPMQAAPERDDSKYMDRLRQAKATIDRYYPRATRNQRIEIDVQGNRLNDCRYEVYIGKSPVTDGLHPLHQFELKVAKSEFDQHGDLNRYNEEIQLLQKAWSKEYDQNQREHNRRVKTWAKNRDECYEALDLYEAIANSLKDQRAYQ